jgi:hypothetical protein
VVAGTLIRTNNAQPFIAVIAERVPNIRRDDHDVARSRLDLTVPDREYAASVDDDDCSTIRVTVGWQVGPWRILRDPEGYAKTVIFASELARCPACRREGSQVCRPDEDLVVRHSTPLVEERQYQAGEALLQQQRAKTAALARRTGQSVSTQRVQGRLVADVEEP